MTSAPSASSLSSRLPLSIDWEDWHQLCLPGFDRYEAFADRLTRATDLTLELCSDLGAGGTWFCLGEQAARHPELVRAVASAGHRIGVHGFSHGRVFELGRSVWREELVRARSLLQDLTGQEVAGYRAAEWSLRGEAVSWWEDLPELGFAYDASRAPLRVLGDPGWPRRAHRLKENFWELPPPVAGPLPLWGWALRGLPSLVTRPLLHRLAAEDAGTPVVLHPWELDEAQLRLPEVPFGHAFAHGFGLAGYGERLRRLLRGIQLVPLEAWIQARGYPEKNVLSPES